MRQDEKGGRLRSVAIKSQHPLRGDTNLRILTVIGRWPSTISALVCALCAAPSFAAYDGPMRFSVFWPCSGNGGSCIPRILAEGVIKGDTALRFQEFLSNKRVHEFELPPQPVISFDSAGGSLAGAVELGRLLRRLRLDTDVQSSYERVVDGDEQIFRRGVVCASACTIAFLGGFNRTVGLAGQFGVHQFFSNGGGSESAAQVTVVALAQYIEEMGVSRRVLDIASLVPPAQIRLLNAQERQALRIDNSLVLPAAWELKAMPNGAVYAQVVQEQAVTHAVVFLALAGERGRTILSVGYSPAERTQAILDKVKDALNDEQLVVLTLDKRTQIRFPTQRWQSSGASTVMTTLALTDAQVDALRRANTVRLEVTLSMADSYYSPTIDIELASLAPLIPAVVRRR